MTVESISIERDILKALENTITEARQRVVKQAVEQFEKEIRVAVGQVAVSLANYYTVERIGAQLLIRVQMEKTAAP